MTDAELERLLVLDGAPGPALTLEAFDAEAIINAALAAAGFGPAGGGGHSGGAGGGAGAQTAGMAVGTKLAILGGLVMLAIAIALYIGRPHHGEQQAAPPPADAAIDAPRDAAGSGSGVDAAVEAPPIETIEMPTDHVPHGTPHDKKTPADLLGEANAKRAEKKWRESDDLYAKVIERAPKTMAAQTALVASGSLHLEHLGDPKGATQRFKKALAIAKGPLAEDARWGLAEAARASHDDKAEAAALDDFIKHHPDSALITQAKARRAELK